MFTTVSVIGGDLRQRTVAELMAAEGFDVTLRGFERGESMKDIYRALDAQAVILPVPVSFDGTYINMPFSDKRLSVRTTAKRLNPSATVFGGGIKPDLARMLEERGIKHCDYLAREELAIRNAVPTAEGAVEIAISEMPITLHGSRCLVTGYGRIGKVLARMLKGMGAHVSVEARKYADLAMIDSIGCEAVSLGELPLAVGSFDAVFNTVPALLFDRAMLSRVRKGTLIIDLASKPGGVDFEAAKELGLRVIWALSLPGKVAPVTSGAIIKDTIINIMGEIMLDKS